MTDELLDIERLRKHWVLRPEEQAPVAPPRALMAEDVAPAPIRDPRELLASLETLALTRFPAQRSTLEAFFQQARELMRESPDEPGVIPAANRAPLRSTLNHLEELLEVFALGLTR
nr:hypothetical protein [Archangium sp.]